MCGVQVVSEQGQTTTSTVPRGKSCIFAMADESEPAAAAAPDALVTMFDIDMRHYERPYAIGISPCRRYAAMVTRNKPSVHFVSSRSVLVVVDFVTGRTCDHLMRYNAVSSTVGFLGDRVAVMTWCELMLFDIIDPGLTESCVLRLSCYVTPPSHRQYVAFSLHPGGQRALVGHAVNRYDWGGTMVIDEIDTEGRVLRTFDTPSFYIGPTMMAVVKPGGFGYRFVDSQGNKVRRPWPGITRAEKLCLSSSPLHQRSVLQWGRHLAEVRGKAIRVWDVAARTHLGDVPVDRYWHGPLMIMSPSSACRLQLGDPEILAVSDDRVVFCDDDGTLNSTTVDPVDGEYRLERLGIVNGGVTGNICMWFECNGLRLVHFVGDRLVLQAERPIDFARFWYRRLGTHNKERVVTLLLCLWKISGAGAENLGGGEESGGGGEESGGEESGGENSGEITLRSLWTPLVIDRIVWFCVTALLEQPAGVSRDFRGALADV